MQDLSKLRQTYASLSPLEDSILCKAESCRLVAVSDKMNNKDQLYFQYTP